MPHLLIAGYFGFGNTGDEAILAGMLHDLRALAPEASFTVVSGDPADTQAAHGVASVGWTDVRALVQAAQESDLLILGGGGLFHDYWPADQDAGLTASFAGLPSYAGLPALGVLLGKPVMLYAVGVGPLTGEAGRELTRGAFELANRATVRDAASRDALTRLGLSAAEEMAVTADPAFSLPVDPAVASDLLRQAGIPGDRPRLGVALRHWEFGPAPRRWEQQVAQGLDAFLQATGAHALFLPFQRREGRAHEDDDAVHRRIAAHMAQRDRTVLLERPLPPAQAAALLGSCDLVLAMRMHGALLPLNAGVPAVALGYDPKVGALMAAAGQGDRHLPPDRWHAAEVSAALEKAADQGPPPREPLQDLRAAARENARLALDLLARPASQRWSLPPALRSFALRKALQVVDLEEQLTLTQALREQRDLLVIQKNRLETELGNLRETLGVRLLGLYWSAMKRLFPEGSRAREAYHLALGLLRSALASWAPEASGVEPVAPDRFRRVGRVLGVDRKPRERTTASDARLELLRFDEEVRRRGAPMVVAILSTTQLIQSEGQRATNLALEFSRRGIPVVFAPWRWDASPWTTQERLREGILQVPIDVLIRHPSELFGSFRGLERVVLFEFPHPGFFAPLATANAEGWITLYDVIDNWEDFHRAGQAPWYDGSFEAHMVRACDAAFAVNSYLAEKVRILGGTQVELLPNGYRAGIEAVDQARPLERGEVTVGYFGHLSDAWFDWDLVLGLARAEPAWKIYLIGYGRDREVDPLPDNLVLLGKRPQSTLASFAANWDAALVPFRPGRLASGTDAIKVYEYLAMGLPVVATGVQAPPGAERFVLSPPQPGDLAQTVREAVAQPEALRQARRDFAATCSWSRRVDALLEAVRAGGQRIGEKRALFEARP